MSEVLALRHKTFLSTNFAKERRNDTAFAGKNNFEEDKNMKKRLLSAFLAVMMVLTMAPVAFAADRSVGSYDELVKAISSASDGDTITVSGTIEVEKPLTVTKTVTLTGGVLEAANDFAVPCDKLS